MNRWSSLHKRRIILSLTSRYIAVEANWPSQCTDAIIRRTNGLSGAEEHPLGASLFDSNAGVGWTAEVSMKHRFIRCWSNLLGASLSNSNEGVGWTAGQSVGSSGVEAVEVQTLLLPNPKASDELMLVPSVHPTDTFELSSCRTHLTQLESRASDHLTLLLGF
jgi:hypothetical protein